MAIPNTQLETWAKQGSITQSSTTYATIKTALASTDAAYAGKDYKVFLQGSYCNDTNIYAESDVDTVLRLNDCFPERYFAVNTAGQRSLGQGVFGCDLYPFQF